MLALGIPSNQQEMVEYDFLGCRPLDGDHVRRDLRPIDHFFVERLGDDHVVRLCQCDRVLDRGAAHANDLEAATEQHGPRITGRLGVRGARAAAGGDSATGCSGCLHLSLGRAAPVAWAAERKRCAAGHQDGEDEGDHNESEAVHAAHRTTNGQRT